MNLRYYKLMKLFLVIIIFLIGFSCRAQVLVANTVLFSNNDQIELTITIDPVGDSVSFLIEGPKNKWFGFILNSRVMFDGAYSLVTNANGESTKEYAIVFHDVPNKHSDQNITMVSEDTSGTRVKYLVSRKLNSPDSLDYDFSPDQEFIRFAYAIGNSTTLAYHQDRGSATLLFNEVVGIRENDKSEKEVVSVNPVGESIQLTRLIHSEYQILNMKGNVVQYGEIDDSEIYCRELPIGVYFLELFEGNSVRNYRFMKK